LHLHHHTPITVKTVGWLITLHKYLTLVPPIRKLDSTPSQGWIEKLGMLTKLYVMLIWPKITQPSSKQPTNDDKLARFMNTSIPMNRIYLTPLENQQCGVLWVKSSAKYLSISATMSNMISKYLDRISIIRI
jgi:hypothetical protein